MDLYYIESTKGTVVECNGKEYTLLGDVECRLNYLDNPVEPHAFAVDANGDEFEIFWWFATIDDFDVFDPIGVQVLEYY